MLIAVAFDITVQCDTIEQRTGEIKIWEEAYVY